MEFPAMMIRAISGGYDAAIPAPLGCFARQIVHENNPFFLPVPQTPTAHTPQHLINLSKSLRMAPESEESYALYCEYSPFCYMTVPDILAVVSAESILMTKSSNLYVEIRLDGAAMQHTRAIEGPAPNWNEEFRMYV
jgi:hypothetical protein